MSSGGLGGKGNWLDIFGLLNFIAKLRNVFHRQHWYLSSCVSKEAYLCEVIFTESNKVMSWERSRSNLPDNCDQFRFELEPEEPSFDGINFFFSCENSWQQNWKKYMRKKGRCSKKRFAWVENWQEFQDLLSFIIQARHYTQLMQQLLDCISRVS